MLQRSLGAATGENVEQVEIDFAPDVSTDHVVSTWISTVEGTAVLRSHFVIHEDGSIHLVPVDPSPNITVEQFVPDSWQDWLANDRLDQLPLEGGLPWRTKFWPEARKLIWTFHHALLDGRSIAKILTLFQDRLSGADDSANLESASPHLPGPDEIAKDSGIPPIRFCVIGRQPCRISV